MSRIATANADAFIVARAEFTSHGALRGTGVNNHNGLQASPGRLPDPHRTAFLAAQPAYGTRPGAEDADVLYVVFSYATPIAWFTAADGWVVPDVKYSVTTSKHQGVVRRAVLEV